MVLEKMSFDEKSPFRMSSASGSSLPLKYLRLMALDNSRTSSSSSSLDLVQVSAL